MWLVLQTASAQDPSCPARGAWPGATWDDVTDEVRASVPDTATALDAWLFPAGLDRTDPERKGIRTDGVVIVHRGQVVYERYGGDWTADRPHLAWSATKTFTNALAGIAVREGRLDLQASICPTLRAPAAACAVRPVDLLEFASGFDWRETYEGASPRSSSVLAMLYGEGRADMARFVTGHPLRDPPGTTWSYSSGDTNVLMAVVRAALEPAHGAEFPWAVLFDPLGITSATWERDGAGTYVGSSYLWATPRDLARFGYLWLADGCWNGTRLLPEGWVEASTAVSDPIRRRPLGREPGDVQGRQVWLNRTIPEQGQTTLPWPSAPEGAYAALGHWKQSITVLPTADLVVVRVADDRDGTYEHDRTLQLALALVEGR